MNFRLYALFVLMIINQLSNSMQEDTEQTTRQKRVAEEKLEERAAKISRNSVLSDCQNINSVDRIQDEVDSDVMQIRENNANCIQMQDQAEQRELSTQHISTINYSGYDEVKKLILQTIHNDLHSKFELLRSYDLINILIEKANNFFATTLIGHTDHISLVSFSYDGKKLATGCNDYTAKIWDVDSGNLIHNLTGHNHWIKSLSFSPDGKRLATGSFDNTAKIWDIDSGNLIHNLSHTKYVNSISFSPDSKKLATCSDDKTAKIWDVDTGNLIYNLTEHTAIVKSISFSPDNTKLATSSADKTAKIWDVNTGKLIHNLICNNCVDSLAFNHDGKKLATCSGFVVKIWNADTGNLIHNLTGHLHVVKSISFSPDSKKLATGSYDNTAKIWDVDTGNLICNLANHTNIVPAVLFNKDGKKLATASWDKTAKIWDVDNGNLIYNLKHPGFLYSISFSPDGTKIATCANKTAKIWHLNKIYAVEDAFKTLNYEQLESLSMIFDAFKNIENNQYIKLSDAQKAIVDSLPDCMKVPLKMALKTLLTKFII